MHKVQLRTRVSPAAVANIAGKRLLPEHLPFITSSGNVAVFKPDGKLLLLIARGAIPVDLSFAVLPILVAAATRHGSSNRGTYAGLKRVFRAREDGTISKNSSTRRADGTSLNVQSAIVGYFDRQGGRNPFCRPTVFVREEVESWEALQPLIRRAAEVYQREDPTRFAIQDAEAGRVHPAWRIHGTPFTTLTINANVLGAVHQDKGDYKGGLGCITVHRRGAYFGGVLGFPEFGVGADLHDGDLILFDPHEWHGVTEMANRSEDAMRVSVVYYMRAKMVECGSPEEEFARAASMKDRQSMGEFR